MAMSRSPEVAGVPKDRARGPGAARGRNPGQQNAQGKALTAARLRGFVGSESAAWGFIKSFFGPHVTTEQLRRIAEICEHHLDLHLDREALRLRSVLVKWFAENLEAIQPFVESHMHVRCVDGSLIGMPSVVERVQREVTE